MDILTIISFVTGFIVGFYIRHKPSEIIEKHQESTFTDTPKKGIIFEKESNEDEEITKLLNKLNNHE